MADISHDPLLQVHRRLDAHDGRLGQLERRQDVAAERADAVQKSLGKIEEGITWLMRLVIGGIVAGIVAFLIKGGFNV